MKMKGYFSFNTLNMQQREALLQRLERLTELPLLLLSFAMVPLLLGPILWEPPKPDPRGIFLIWELISERWRPDPRVFQIWDLIWDRSRQGPAIFLILEISIWALFAADLAVKIAVAPKRLAYVRGHWLDVLIVAIPFARPLRLVRIVLFGVRGLHGLRRLLNLDYLFAYAIGLILIAATVVTASERGHDTINNFLEAIWWSVVTVTTVGYGDVTPVTAVGRIVATVLMFGGIGLFGALTANLASFIVRSDNRDSANQQLLEEVRLLQSQIDRLEEAVTVRMDASLE